MIERCDLLMDFKKLKEEIEQAPNKKSFLGTSPIFNTDSFKITSSLYSNDIYCNNVTSINDIYNVINQYQLDSQLFNSPFYLTVSLEDFNENTVNIINQLDSRIFVQIATHKDIDIKKAQLLSKITRENSQFYFSGWINQDAIDLLSSKFIIDQECSPVLVINKIDATTVNIINNYCSLFKNPRFRIEVKDSYSLQNLYDIIPYIPEDEIFIELDNNIFNERNLNNARNLIVQSKESQVPQGKKLKIRFNDIEYENVEQIYELEKYLEIIKSHIPSNASELDIVTYVSIFIINYFKYDYDMCEKSNKREDFDDINLTQFISSGKGVCRHFASFTKYLLNSMNIVCERINSDGDYYNNSEAEGHAFNVVKIDGKMYFLDNTWLAGRIQAGEIRSLAESSDFLTSNNTFGHEEFADALEDYKCEDYNRQEINNSINRVVNWNQNYKIHLSALRDLFRKHILKKEKNIEERIEEAIPRRR